MPSAGPDHPNAASRPDGEATLSERAAALIERDVLSGDLEPGTRLAIHALSRHYALGTTPLREGLSRLVTRGLITAIGQRGFRVAHVSRADLEDITRVRILVETEALKLSMQQGGDAWEVGIVAALHHLRLCLDRSPRTIAEGTAEFDRLHKAFHRALIAGCGSERLLALHDDLYLQAYRYRRVMMQRLAEPSWFLRQHQSLADAVTARRTDLALQSLAQHLGQTVATVYGGAEAP
jgi:GntR family carbon starvation induced transcriptional regulator